MTTQQLAPPVPSTSPHLYAGVAYVTHEGRIQATATFKTPNQAARIERLFQRLTTSHTPY